MVLRWKILLIAFSLFLPPLSAHALLQLGDARLNKILKLEPGVCAMEVGVLNNLGVLDLQDRVTVADHLLARLGSLLDILDLDLLQGDTILIASDSFENLTGIPVDISLDDTECDHLAANLPIRLLNLFNAEIDVVILDPDFTENHAMVRTGPGNDDWVLVSLEEDSIEVSNVTGDSSEVAAEGSGETSSTTQAGGGTTPNIPGTFPNDTFAGGCSLTKGLSAQNLNIGIFLIGLLALIGGVRIYRAI